MVQYNPLQHLPTAEELPDSDDTPVDNELQNLVPNLLLAMLSMIWAERIDWFFGVDMGIYYLPGQFPPTSIVPDGFLSLGVDRRKSKKGRLSYVMWQENNIAPILVLEVVSQNYGGEYDSKMSKYMQLGVLYYVIYNPEDKQRDNHEPLEVYRLIAGQYELQSGEPFWMPEVGLGIGRSQGTYKGWTREWLYWYAQNGDRPANQWRRSLSPDEQVEQERQRAEQERQRAEQERQRAEQERQRAEQAEQLLAQEQQLRAALIDRLRAQGITLDDF
jgi:Uma2 family endonuclease